MAIMNSKEIVSSWKFQHCDLVYIHYYIDALKQPFPHEFYRSNLPVH